MMGTDRAKGQSKSSTIGRQADIPAAEPRSSVRRREKAARGVEPQVVREDPGRRGKGYRGGKLFHLLTHGSGRGGHGGSITPRQFEAGSRFALDYHLATGARTADYAGDPGGGGDAHGWIVAKAEASAAFSAAYRHLGRALGTVVFRVCVEDVDPAALAREAAERHARRNGGQERNVRSDQVMEILRLGLDDLGDFYGLPW